ncbi:MAG: ATP-dependent helicase, partial [Lutibacter sp.]
AKASGIALSFCNAEEKAYLKDIQKLINQEIPVISEHPFIGDGIEDAPIPKGPSKNQKKKLKRRSENQPKEGENTNKKRKWRPYSKKRR